MSTFGLLGRNIEYSFSRAFFTNKFKKEGLDHNYVNFDLADLSLMPKNLLNTPNLKGFNVTIPYKEEIQIFLDDVDLEAHEIGAVNTVKLMPNLDLIGYNTDCYGFSKALQEFLPTANKRALILGTGGASKAVAYALSRLDYTIEYVSRSGKNNGLSFKQVDKNTLSDYSLIINCTPLGTYPNINSCPDIPYQHLGPEHVLFDLVYNPEETRFLQLGKAQGARTTNGRKMLVYQAEKSWEIWNS